MFAYGLRQGDLAVVSVLGSLYPIPTVLLGWLMLHERVARVQFAGIILALLGVALLAGRTPAA
jgi:drug/metabolite transporter (DMT)-like permease